MVPAAVLAGYAGTYAISPKLHVVIAYEHGQLTAQGGDFPKVALYGLSLTQFFSKSLDDVTLEFITAADGGVSIVLHQKGQADMPGKRLATWS